MPKCLKRPNYKAEPEIIKGPQEDSKSVTKQEQLTREDYRELLRDSIYLINLKNNYIYNPFRQ